MTNWGRIDLLFDCVEKEENHEPAKLVWPTTFSGVI